jgi:hypothetical protein
MPHVILITFTEDYELQWNSVDGYFANLIRVRTARGVCWFLDFVLLLEF